MLSETTVYRVQRTAVGAENDISVELNRPRLISIATHNMDPSRHDSHAWRLRIKDWWNQLKDVLQQLAGSVLQITAIKPGQVGEFLDSSGEGLKSNYNPTGILDCRSDPTLVSILENIMIGLVNPTSLGLSIMHAIDSILMWLIHIVACGIVYHCSSGSVQSSVISITLVYNLQVLRTKYVVDIMMKIRRE